MKLIDLDKVYESACAGCTRHGDAPGECYHDEPCERLIVAFTTAEPVHAVVLPCKPGTTVYEIMNNTDACLDCDYRYFSYVYNDEECEHPEHQTDNPSLAKSPVCEKHFMEVVSYPATERQLFSDREKFGKTIFLTHEEAEAALAKWRNEHET